MGAMLSRGAAAAPPGDLALVAPPRNGAGSRAAKSVLGEVGG